MDKTRVLDLFCGAGGAAEGYRQAFGDVEIIGVDIAPQPRYPFTFVQADAMEYPADGFDFIHASPPCQAFTAYRRRPDHVGEYPDLIAPTRERLEATGVPYVIENVRGAPLLDTAIQLCGSSFGLDVRRHRLFESNVTMLAPPCNHGWQTPRFPPATNRTNLRSTVEVGVWRIPLDVQQRAMGIDWMELRELSEAIPPAYTRWLGNRIVEAMERQEAA